MQRFFLDNLWRWIAGQPEVNIYYPTREHYIKPLDIERATLMPPEFDELRYRRLLFGYMRYQHKPKAQKYDYIDALKRHVRAYEETGNLEHMVDAANYAMLEFKKGHHPNRHFKSIDDNGETHAKVLQS